VSKHTLFDDFEYSGNWWLPDRPEDTVGGTLSYKEGLLQLELFKPFSVDGSAMASDGEFNPKVILGQSKGTALTLYKARGLSMRPGYFTFFRAKYLLTGKHFDPEDVVLTSLSVRFTHLEEWIGKRPFETDLQGGSSRLGSIDYVPPEPIEFDLAKKDCRLLLSDTSTHSMGDFRSIRWEHSAWVDISTVYPREADWYSDTAISLSQLLSLLVGKRVVPIALRGHVVGERELVEEGFVQGPVDIFKDGFARPGQEEREMTWPRRVLVPLPALGSGVSHVFNSWFERPDKAQPVYNLYLAILASRSTYVEFAFLGLTQALEGFHRRFVRAERTNFKSRMTELLQQLGDEVQALIAEDPGAWIDMIKKTRHYLTHYFDEGEDQEGWAQDFTALAEANYRLRRMCAALLWQQLGIESGVIRDAVAKIDIDPYQT
jgi:hypothetical protein